MRARRLILLALLGAACSRGADLAGPPSDGVAHMIASPGRPSFAAAPTSAPAGLVGCWAGDGNARDVVGGNDGVASGAVSFAAGKFGQAFSFSGLGGDVRIPASTALNVGVGDGLTFSAWIFPKGTVFGPAVGAGPVLEFEHGAQLWQHLQFGDPNTGLFANLAESDLVYHIHQVGGVVTPGQWTHAAVTYSRSAGTITIYANGVAYALTTAGSFTPNTTSMLHIGARVAGSFGTNQFTFNGMIDEVQIYNRALSAAEVASLAAATGSLCAPPAKQLAVTAQPGGAVSGVAFTTQPHVEVRDASNTLVAGASAAVTAAIASGTGALSGTTTVNAVNGVASFTDLKIAGSGNHTLSFSSTGLTSAVSNPFNVTAPIVQPPVTAFKWQGFFDPIDNLPKVNKLKPGKSIEVKFSLGGKQGMDIFASGFPASEPASCSTWLSGGPAQAIDLRGNAGSGSDDKGDENKGGGDKGDRGDGEHGNGDHPDGNSGLKYEDGRYSFTWKTDKSWAGTCRFLDVKLTDGSLHTARFSFGK